MIDWKASYDEWLEANYDDCFSAGRGNDDAVDYSILFIMANDGIMPEIKSWKDTTIMCIQMRDLLNGDIKKINAAYEMALDRKVRFMEHMTRVLPYAVKWCDTGHPQDWMIDSSLLKTK